MNPLQAPGGFYRHVSGDQAYQQYWHLRTFSFLVYSSILFLLFFFFAFFVPLFFVAFRFLFLLLNSACSQDANQRGGGSALTGIEGVTGREKNRIRDWGVGAVNRNDTSDNLRT